MPRSNLDIIHAFGDPGPYTFDDGSVSPTWETLILYRIALPETIPLAWDSSRRVGVIRCHARIAPQLEAAFVTLFNEGAWSDLEDFGGCYAWRFRRHNPHELSRHSWGIAIDLNVRRNPYGAPPAMPQPVIEAFEAQGFQWGGRWAKPDTDGMHFEFADLGRLGTPV